MSVLHRDFIKVPEISQQSNRALVNNKPGEIALQKNFIRFSFEDDSETAVSEKRH